MASEEQLIDEINTLDRDGFILVRGALDMETVQAWRECLYRKVQKEEWDGKNAVGNVWFDYLLKQEPNLARSMIGHESVAPYLKAMLGRQCQLRSFRAHVNPDAYTQEWHSDFMAYWESDNEARHALQPLCINTTFYLTDNTPDRGRLTFLPGYSHKKVPDEVNRNQGYDSNGPFYRWCEEQEKINLHPMSGDAVVFFSHIPHQGAKLNQDPPDSARCNIVLHYQQTPMYPGLPFVSSPNATIDALGYDGTFPFSSQ